VSDARRLRGVVRFLCRQSGDAAAGLRRRQLQPVELAVDAADLARPGSAACLHGVQLMI
jgi:hypothetical protein